MAFKFFKKKSDISSDDISSEDIIEENIAIEDVISGDIEQDIIQDAPTQNSLLSRLKSGLSKTSNNLSDGITGIFTRKKLDSLTLEELEELLIMADMGADAARQIIHNFAESRYEKDLDINQIKALLAKQIAQILSPVQGQITLATKENQPTIIMVVGVNGNGKTTTIGKMAAHFKNDGKSVMLVAADTFRAAAVEQLQIWANRVDVPIITGAHEADPASVAFLGLQQAQANNVDVLLIDTAGRLQNKANLMQELQKIKRVLDKAIVIDGSANYHTNYHVIMVLDGTTGQNAISQVKAFAEMVNITGLVITKLDGTARGGIVVALAKQFGLPIHFVGVGEGIDDLQPFNANDFANNIVGVE